MIIKNESENVLDWDMTYKDDSIFEDYKVMGPRTYHIDRSSESSHSVVNQDYNIIQPVGFNVQRGTGFVYNNNLSSAYTGENQPDNVIKYNIVPVKEEPKTSWFKKLLKTFSQYGMNYDDDIMRNIYAIPADPNLLPKSLSAPQDIYSKMLQWKKKSNEDQNFFEKDLSVRREVLRKLAQQPELEDILDVMCNEAIVYDSDNTYICQPYIDSNVIETLTDEAESKIKDTVDKAFYKFYMLLEWKTRAWDEFKRYLIDGVLSYEIVYDSIEHPHHILGFIPLDPATLTRTIESGITYWYQYKGVTGKERKLLDAQIIYVKYQDSGVVARQSYLERLIRPFNIYRIIEQAQIIWTVTQASFKTVFTIPVGNQGRARGRETINSAMAAYREDIAFDSESGELKINGKVNLPFNKEYWLPENENGKPQIETLVDKGPDLNDSEQLKYFKNELYKMSKIPPSRFDQDNGATWFGTDVSSMLRDEINFSRFVSRIRNAFAQILLKPLQIQLAMSMPEIKGDKRIVNAISLRFVSYNQFEELMDIEVMTKRIDFISQMQESLTSKNKDGEDEAFFSARYLAEKYLKMSNAEFRLNERYKKITQSELNLSDNEPNEYDSDRVTIGGTKNLDEYEGKTSSDMGVDKVPINAEEASGPDDEEQSEFDIPV